MENFDKTPQGLLILWENLCEMHTDLYDLTCKEYLALLESDLDELTCIIVQKEKLIKKIDLLELERRHTVATFSEVGQPPIRKFTELRPLLPQKTRVHLRRLNLLLIDIIEKIQVQNAENQSFLQAALVSLDELQMSFRGQKEIVTYGPKGQTSLAGHFRPVKA